MPAITSASNTDVNHVLGRPVHWATAVWTSFSRSSSLWAFDILCLPGFYEVVPNSNAYAPEHPDAG